MVGAYAGTARHVCEKRGVKSDQGLGVANLGTDEPARRSRWFSPA